MRLFLYTLRSLSFNLLFLLAVLASIMLVIQSIRFVDLLMTRTFSFVTLITFFSLLVPYILYFILPLSVFIAVLYTYQKLHQERELIAMRAAGLSSRQIALPAILIGLLMTAFGYYNSFVLLPKTTKMFKNMQYDLKEDITATLIKENQFNELGPNLTIFIRQKIRAQEFKGIVIQDNRNPSRKYTYVADVGRFVPIPGGLRLTLLRGSQQEFSDGSLKQVRFDQLIHEIEMEKAESIRKDTNTMEKSVSFLLKPPAEPDVKQVHKYQVAGHDRIASPLYVLAFMLLCMSLLLQGPYQRRGDHKKMIAIVLSAFGLQSMAIAAKNLSYSIPAFTVLLYVIPMVVILFSSYSLVRGKNA